MRLAPYRRRAAEKFLRFVKWEGDCLVWTGPRDRDGYGITCFGARAARAPRAVWRLLCGDIPPGLFVCHSCDNPPCVNPGHLFLSTSDGNIADRHTKGRDARGERQHLARATEEVVREIRRSYATGTVTLSELATAFGLSKGAVSSIIAHRTWKHVRDDDSAGSAT